MSNKQNVNFPRFPPNGGERRRAPGGRGRQPGRLLGPGVCLVRAGKSAGSALEKAELRPAKKALPFSDNLWYDVLDAVRGSPSPGIGTAPIIQVVLPTYKNGIHPNRKHLRQHPPSSGRAEDPEIPVIVLRARHRKLFSNKNDMR